MRGLKLGRQNWHQLWPYFLVVFCLLPYFVLIGFGSELAWPDSRIVARALLVSAAQGLLTASLSLALGLLGGLGLLSVANTKTRRLIGYVAWLPSFMPTIFILVGVMNFFSSSLRGLVGIVLIQSFIYTGLIAYRCEWLISVKAGRMLELARVEGASPWQALRAVLGFLRGDLLYDFLFVFALAYSSFSVPSILGGPGARNLEILLYELIQQGFDLRMALSLSWLQTFFVFLIMSLFARGNLAFSALEARSVAPVGAQYLGVPAGLVFLLIPTVIPLWGLLQDLPRGVSLLRANPELAQAAVRSLPGTWLVALSVGLASLALLAAVAGAMIHQPLHRFLRAWIAPSTVLTGFALVLIGGPSLGRITLGVLFIYFPSLCRLGWLSRISDLRGQIESAQVLGADRWSIFRCVVWPQIRGQALTLSALASFWASGEFALSSVVSGQDRTLALVLRRLMQTYRFEQASVFCWILLVTGALVFLFIRSFSHVFGAKSAALLVRE